MVFYHSANCTAVVRQSCVIEEPRRLWELDEGRKTYKFRCLEGGKVRLGGPYADQDAFDTYNIAEHSEGIITTNRPMDDMVEIGIKSIVWKQVSGFQNMNSQPDEKTIETYQNAGVNIQLGRLQTYQYRMSFFSSCSSIGEKAFVTLDPDMILR